MTYEKAEARVAAGYSVEEWDALPGSPAWIDPENPTWSKCDVLIWWRIRNQIPAVSNDIQSRELKRKRPHA